MAVTDITATVLRITGISPTANSIEDAQRFVASSIPKELLRWSSSFTTVENNGGDATDTSITIPTGTDSILDVSRNGFSATEVPYGMKGFIANTASLHKATNTYPKYYLDNAVEAKGVLVVVHPIPTDTETAVALYVDFSKVGDECDLRNAVIYHTSAQEFTKLGSDELPTISINIVPPDIPSLSTIIFNGPSSANGLDATAPSFEEAGVYGTASGFNAYFPLTDFGDSDPGEFILITAPPEPPTLSTIEYSPVGVVDGNFPTDEPFTVTEVEESGIYGIDNSFQSYFLSATFNPFSDSDPGPLVIAAVPPDTPTVPDFNVNFTTPLPTYDSDFPNNGNLTVLVPSTTADEDQTLFHKWFDVAGDFIEDEDTELSTAQIQKITAYLEAYGKQMQNSKNVFDTELEKYKAELNNELGKAQYEQQAEHTVKLQQHQSEVAHYQAEVAAEVGEYTQKLQRYITELGMIQQSWTTEFQAGIQESMQVLQTTNQRNIAAAQAELQLNLDNASRSQQRQLQNAINDMQRFVHINDNKINKYQADTTTYQSEVNSEVQAYTQKLSRYNAELNIAYQSWGQELQAAIQESAAELQANLQVAVSNKDRELQRNLQNAINDMKVLSDTNAQTLQKFQVEVAVYQAEVATETAEYQSKIQKQQTYSKEADKYYQWANAEINIYIRNHSSMISKTIAAQSLAQQHSKRQ